MEARKRGDRYYLTMKFWQAVLILVGGILVSMSVIFATVKFFERRASLAYVRELQLAKNVGVPMTMPALQLPLPPANQNAAPYYIELGAYLAKHPLTNQEQNDMVFKSDHPISTQECKAARKVLMKYPEITRLIHAAANCPKCVFTRNWNKKDPADVSFSDLLNIRFAARWLSTESVILAYDGKSVDAVKNEQLGFRLAQHGGTDPTIISYLVGIAVENITLSAMKKILYIRGDDPKVCQAALKSIIQEKPQNLAFCMRGDTTFRIVTIQKLKSDGPKSIFTSGIFSLLITRGIWNTIVNNNGVVILANMRKMILAADAPYQQALPVMQSVDRESKSPGFNHILVPIFMPDAIGIVKRRARAQGYTNVTVIAANVLKWKTVHGVYPQSLQQLGEQIPLDPYTEKPLQYRRETKGFVVYSVGQSGIFDGGSPGKKPNVDEVVFRYPKPTYYQNEAATASH